MSKATVGETNYTPELTTAAFEVNGAHAVVSAGDEVNTTVRNLEGQLKSLYSDLNEIKKSTSAVEDLEAQLTALYLERDILEKELGSADPAQIISLVHGLKKHTLDKQNGNGAASDVAVNSLVAALKQQNLIAEQERTILQKELGFSNANEVVKNFRSLEVQLQDVIGISVSLANINDVPREKLVLHLRSLVGITSNLAHFNRTTV